MGEYLGIQRTGKQHVTPYAKLSKKDKKTQQNKKAKTYAKHPYAQRILTNEHFNDSSQIRTHTNPYKNLA